MYLSYRWSVPSNYMLMVFSRLPTSLTANLQSPNHLFSILKPARNLLLLTPSLQISGNMPPQPTSKLPPIFSLAAGKKSSKAPRPSWRRLKANIEPNHRSLTSLLMNQKTKCYASGYPQLRQWRRSASDGQKWGWRHHHWCRRVHWQWIWIWERGWWRCGDGFQYILWVISISFIHLPNCSFAGNIHISALLCQYEPLTIDIIHVLILLPAPDPTSWTLT